MAFKIDFLGTEASNTNGNNRFDNIAITALKDSAFFHFPNPFVLHQCRYEFTEWADTNNPMAYPEHGVFVLMEDEEPLDNAEIEAWVSGNYDLNSGTRVVGLNDSGVAFVNSAIANPDFPANRLGGMLMNINLRHAKGAKVQFTAGTVEPKGHEYAIKLQYRVGDEGPFFDVADSLGNPIEYHRKSFVHDTVFGPFSLPDTLLGESHIQLFWRYFFTHQIADSTDTDGDMLRLDNILLSTDTSMSHNLNSSVKVKGDTLSARAMGLYYQWIDCLTGQPIQGANKAVFIPDSNGIYKVAISNNDCSDTSQCYQIAHIKNDRWAFDHNLYLFPNPAHEYLNLKSKNTLQDVTILLTNAQGILIDQWKFDRMDTIELETVHYSPGLYFITIVNNDYAKTLKFIKN